MISTVKSELEPWFDSSNWSVKGLCLTGPGRLVSDLHQAPAILRKVNQWPPTLLRPLWAMTATHSFPLHKEVFGGGSATCLKDLTPLPAVLRPVQKIVRVLSVHCTCVCILDWKLAQPTFWQVKEKNWLFKTWLTSVYRSTGRASCWARGSRSRNCDLVL